MEPQLINSNGCEFGYEIVMMVPYVFYLHTQKVPLKVVSSPDMKPFYFFLKDDEFIGHHTSRRYCLPSVKLKALHSPALDKTSWQMPDFIKAYSQRQLKTPFSKKLIIVSNKYNKEWNHAPVNFLSLYCLRTLFELTSSYDVIYNRVQSARVISDIDALEFNDGELLKEFPHVHDINQLHDLNGINFNELQLILTSQSQLKISVQGGTSIMSSLTGGINLIYAVEGGELESGSFSWYPEFSGCYIKHFDKHQNLVEAFKEQLCTLG